MKEFRNKIKKKEQEKKNKERGLSSWRGYDYYVPFQIRIQKKYNDNENNEEIKELTDFYKKKFLRK